MNTRALLACSLLILVTLPAAAQQDRRKPDVRRGFHAVQVALDGRGEVLMSWVRPSTAGHDLFLSRRASGGEASEAVRVSGETGVRWIPVDEARPALAVGPEGRVALAWFAPDGRPRVARSADGGHSFEPPRVVGSGPGRAENAFVEIDYDARGRLYVVWLDARAAPEGMEEPARLFYARVVERGVEDEIDLTPDPELGVCGCCRPAVHVDGARVEVLFRNRDSSGHRDVHRRVGDLDGAFGETERVGPALWKIEACPMAGPVLVGPDRYWRDGSTGRPRIVQAHSTTAPVRAVLEVDGWTPSSPRGVDGDPELLLVPGAPHGQLLRKDAGSWRVLTAELPEWCRSAVRVDRELLLVGDVYGELKLEAFPLDE